jgi:hypothetical protein
MSKTYTHTNIAPMELNKTFLKHFYYDIAPTELIPCKENQIDQLVYQLYGLTKEEIAIIENSIK